MNGISGNRDGALTGLDFIPAPKYHRASPCDDTYVALSGQMKKLNHELFLKIILVQSHQPVADPENTLFKYFSKNFIFVKSNDYEGIKISVFGKK